VCEQQDNWAANYFNYFTEIEEHFQRRRGTILLLTTLVWALIETWQSAGVPLEAVLRGIDAAFGKYDQPHEFPKGDFRSGIPEFRDRAFIERMQRAREVRRRGK